MVPPEDDALFQIVAAPRSQSYADVMARLGAIEDRLAMSDGLRWFNQLYQAMTRAVADAAGSGAFADPEFLERFDCAFAQLYFDAIATYLRGPAAAPSAWRPLLAARSQSFIVPFQFALAGINAHINRDLAVALVATCEELGSSPVRSGPRYEDYMHINAILHDVLEQTKQLLVRGLLGDLDSALGNADDLLAMFSIERARDAAFTAAELRFSLRDLPRLAEQHLRALDDFVGFASRGLLRPVLAAPFVAP